MTWAREFTELRELREQQKAANLRAQKPLVRSVSYTGELTARPNTQPHRNPTLLRMAQGRDCLLRTEVCVGGGETTIAAHSNLAIHGKSKARKADDPFSVWACHACHVWLDFGDASKEEKTRAFMHAHIHQVMEWRRIAQDGSEPEHFRKAAQWALEQLNATAIVEGYE